jgi:hypothetical protein
MFWFLETLRLEARVRSLEQRPPTKRERLEAKRHALDPLPPPAEPYRFKY